MQILYFYFLLAKSVWHPTEMHGNMIGGHWLIVRTPYYKQKTPQVVAGTPTHIFVNNMVITASKLNHYTTRPSCNTKKIM